MGVNFSNATRTQNETSDLKIAAETDKARFDRLNNLFTSLITQLNELSAKVCHAAKINQVITQVTLKFASLPDLSYVEGGKITGMSVDKRIALLKPLCLLPIEDAPKQKVLSILAHLYWQIKDYPSAIICARHAGNDNFAKHDGLISLLQYLGCPDLKGAEEDFESACNAAYESKECKEKMEALEKIYKEQGSQFNLQVLPSLKYELAASVFEANKKLRKDSEVATPSSTSLASSTACSHSSGSGSGSGGSGAVAAPIVFSPMTQQPQAVTHSAQSSLVATIEAQQPALNIGSEVQHPNTKNVNVNSTHV